MIDSTKSSCELVVPVSTWSQGRLPRPVTAIADMRGPRFGLPMLTRKRIGTLSARGGVTLQPVVPQLGWHFERPHA